MFAKILAIAKKDIQVFTSDKKAMMLSFLVPIAIGSFFCLIMGGSSKSGGTSKIETLIVMEDHSAVSKLIFEDLGKSDTIKVVQKGRAEATDAVTKGNDSVAVIFPKGFGKAAAGAMFAGEKPKLEVLYDPSKSTERQIVVGALMQVMMNRISQASFSGDGAPSNLKQALANETDPKRKAAWQGMIDAMGVVSPTTAGNSTGGGGFQQPFEVEAKALTASTDPDAEARSARSHIFAGMAVQGVLFFAIESAMSILREKRTGIWGRLRAAPVSMSSILLGRGLGSWIIANLILAGIFVFGMGVLGVRIAGNPLGFLLVLLCTGLMTSAFGLFVSSLGKTEAQSRGLSILAVLMMSMLGGAWFPASMMPSWMQTFSLLIPVRWAVDGFDAMLWRGQPISSALIPCLGLIGFSVLFASVAGLRYRKD